MTPAARQAARPTSGSFLKWGTALLRTGAKLDVALMRWRGQANPTVQRATILRRLHGKDTVVDTALYRLSILQVRAPGRQVMCGVVADLASSSWPVAWGVCPNRSFPLERQAFHEALAPLVHRAPSLLCMRR